MENNTTIANFNVTFGDQEKPLLDYFDEVIVPAFQSNLKRSTGPKGHKDYYYFLNTHIVDIDGDLVYTGQFVKETELDVLSKMVNNKLINTDEHHPAAPYSVFYIFLRNHRMILIKNQKGSPDLRSFRVTVQNIVNRFISINNSDEVKEKLPSANINIIGIPSLKTWDNIFNKVEKVRSIELKFFPLNGDKKHMKLAETLIDLCLNETKAKTGSVKIGSCENIDGVKVLVSNLDGIMDPVITVDYPNRKKVTIRNNMIKETMTIDDKHNIDNPEEIVPIAKQFHGIDQTTEENLVIFEKYKNRRH